MNKINITIQPPILQPERGDIYKHVRTGLYILATVEDGYDLICLNDGGFWFGTKSLDTVVKTLKSGDWTFVGRNVTITIS